MNIILSFIFGLIAGSFLNVVIIRSDDFYNLPEQRKKSLFGLLGGRSHCPNCKKILTWRELVPVLSFFIQKGRCNHCRLPISWQYPLVELGTALVFVLITMQYFKGDMGFW